MTHNIEVNASVWVEDAREAEGITEALRVLLKNRAGVRLYRPNPSGNGPDRVLVPDAPRFDYSQVTRNRQAADATAGAIARKMTVATSQDFPALLKLDEGIRTWNPDYAGMLAVAKEREVEALYRSVVSEVLAGEALRGLK